MIGFLQRVSSASVTVEGRQIAAIAQGCMVLVGIEKDDNQAKAERLVERLLGYRVFTDASGRMNLSLRDIQGGLLLVPQFTLAADTRKGLRPGFSRAASSEQAQALFEYLCQHASQLHTAVAQGRFGADMQVSLTNDGPVSFWLQV